MVMTQSGGYTTDQKKNEEPFHFQWAKLNFYAFMTEGSFDNPGQLAGIER